MFQTLKDPITFFTNYNVIHSRLFTNEKERSVNPKIENICNSDACLGLFHDISVLLWGNR